MYHVACKLFRDRLIRDRGTLFWDAHMAAESVVDVNTRNVFSCSRRAVPLGGRCKTGETSPEVHRGEAFRFQSARTSRNGERKQRTSIQELRGDPQMCAEGNAARCRSARTFRSGSKIAKAKQDREHETRSPNTNDKTKQDRQTMLDGTS